MKLKFILIFILPISFALHAQDYQLGIVTDFDKSDLLDSVLTEITNEINRTTGSSKRIVLKTENITYQNQAIDNASGNYQTVQKRVDIVVLLGGVSIKGALETGAFLKPTFGLGIIDPFLQNIPYDNGISGVTNFSYIKTTTGLDKELVQFKRIVPFKHLTILISSRIDVTIDEAKGIQFIDELKQEQETEIYTLPIDSDIQGSLAKLDPKTDAVYVTDLGNKLPKDIKLIANELIERKIPSFSSFKWHVENGILASLSDENNFEQVRRKLAIMVDEALDGLPAADMSVDISFKEDLIINQQTAKDMDLALPFDILFTSNFIEADEDLPTYSLEEIIDRAFENNFEIKISNQEIELAVQDIKSAKTAVLPTLDLSINGSQINSESASALFDQSERRLSGQLAFNQLIYSEKAIAGIKITQYLQKSQEYATEAEILEVLLNTYIDYFTVLSAKTILTIEQENLENLKTNLELAQIRVNLGSASQSEIFRWESEVAAASQTVVEATTNLLAAKFSLNTFLANSLEREFDIEDVSIDDQVYQQFKDDPISQFVDNPKEINLISDFLVNEAINNNPNKKFIIEQIKAVERRNVQNKRLLYTPDVALQAQTTQVLYRGGEGSTETPGMAGFRDNAWSIGVGLAYPIFSGNARRIDLQTSRIQLEQLDNSRKQLDQNLELAVRNGILRTIATSTNINFSQVSSTNAQDNFLLVRDKYREGDVSITQLIDAQQSALQARQRYAVSIYDYIQSQLELEFSVGFFSMFANAADLEEFRNRFYDFRNNN